MDPATLAATITTFLAPYLAKAGGAILDRAAAGLPDLAGRLWNTIEQRFQGNPAATGAADDLAKNASDPDKKEAFELQLKMALKEDREFAEALLALVKEAGADTSTGNISVKTGDVSHSAIVIGDQNDVKSG